MTLGGAIQIFCGCIDNEERINTIIRNGKDCSMFGFSFLDYLKGAKIWSNCACNFAEYEKIGMQQMIDMLNENPNIKGRLVLCVSEIGEILDSIGSSTAETLFINGFSRQLGKIGDNSGEVILRGTVQRFNDLGKRLRVHTSNILIPAKFHYDNPYEICNSTKCKKHHIIKVFSYKPCLEEPIKIFDAVKVGEKYDTFERVYDKLKIPTKKELAALQKRYKDNNSNQE